MPADLVISTNRIGLRGDVAKDLFQLVANIAAAAPASKPRRVTPEPAFMNTSLHQRKQATPAPSREE